ncbi:MAG: sigma factor-like helix-turn-helix DNA-binding protein [Myxococcota bacterium]|jgi:DNA-directed RNA polymerase specialized sigma24 family protein|nr:sigma factor-like helix-turn-helix DNA-binding protein [Myxococcota bacterium]MEC9441839.1 sigma factor-like helix-turn-helix DNA-binding protein [Myxococcota bacterium]
MERESIEKSMEKPPTDPNRGLLSDQDRARALDEARVFTPEGASAGELGALIKGAMREALGGLDRGEQITLALRYLERLTIEEIACAMGISRGEALCEHEQAMGRLRRAFVLLVGQRLGGNSGKGEEQ